MPISYQFLPWVRRGLTVALTQTDNLGNLPARATAQIGVKLAGAHAGTAITPLPMQLYGPGDVIGIDTALVVRTDPRPGDFWVGCHPDRGWGHTDPDRVGWASFVEEPEAVHQFGVAAGRIETGALIEVSDGYKAAWALQPA